VDEFRADLRDALLGTTYVGENLQSRGDQHIVALRADVLNDAEHALGNLFQRMYHVTRVAREGLGPYADRMTDSLQDLERLLQLVFDYISPVSVDVRPVDAARVVETLAAHVRAHAVTVQTSACPPLEVLADARTLARSFQLLALAFEQELGAASAVAIEVLPGEAREFVTFLMQVVGASHSGHQTQAGLAWEVAGRLVELQGGEVARTMGVGGCTCTVTLPMVEPGHGSR